MDWKLVRSTDHVRVEYDITNKAGSPMFMCHPDPPYVSVNPDRSIRIWLGMYVVGPDEDVEYPIVPEVVRLDVAEHYHGSFVLPLPLDEIHPFPRYEHTKKKLTTSESVHFEIGVIPANDRFPPPTVPEGSRTKLVAPYGWASQTLRYVVGEPKRIAIPILCPETIER